MRILIVGLSVRAMAESAVHSGYNIIALDAFGDQDLRAAAETRSLLHDYHSPYSPAALYKASRQLSFDSVAYTANLENHPLTLSRIAGGRRIIGNSPKVVRSVRRWSALFSDLRKSGFAVPETIFPKESRRIGSGRRWLVKPLLSGGGYGIAFLPSEILPKNQFMLQEYVPGKPCSASFVANGRECVLLGVTEQLIGMRQFGSHGFRYCGNILPFPEALDPDKCNIVLAQLNRLAANVTRQYGLTGVNGIDFILCDHQVWPIEINPRYSASMELMEKAYGLPVFHLHVQSALEGSLPDFKLEAVVKSGTFFGKAILFAEKEAVAPDTQDWAACGIRDIPASGERLPHGGPVCTVLANRPTYEETLNELVRRARIIKEQIYG